LADLAKKSVSKIGFDDLPILDHYPFVEVGVQDFYFLLFLPVEIIVTHTMDGVGLKDAARATLHPWGSNTAT
jgi:hypothetical protein